MHEPELITKNGLKYLRVFYDSSRDNFDEAIELGKLRHKIPKHEPVMVLCLPMKADVKR